MGAKAHAPNKRPQFGAKIKTSCLPPLSEHLFLLSPSSEPAKVSEQMVAAGVEVLWRSGAVEAPLGCDELLVSEIFQAMDRASRL